MKIMIHILKVVVRGETMELGMADHVWKKKCSHWHLFNEMNILDKEKHYRNNWLEESAYILCYEELLSRPSI